MTPEIKIQRKRKNKKTKNGRRPHLVETKIYDVNDFNLSHFLSNYTNEIVLFVSGSQYIDTEDGKYECLLIYGNKKNSISNHVARSISANDAMLQGILYTLKNSIPNNTKLNLVLYTKLGFEHPKKSKNKQLIELICAESYQKHISLQVHLVCKGVTLIRPFIIKHLT